MRGMHPSNNLRKFHLPGASQCSKLSERTQVLLTSKKWRLQSGCNHSTAYVDQ